MMPKVTLNLHYILRYWQTDTLLLMTFPCARKLGNICCGHKMFLNKIRNIFVSQTQNLSATNVARAAKRGNICVGNNVSATTCPRLPVPLDQSWIRHGERLAITNIENLPSSRLNTLISSPTVPSPSNASPVLILRPSPVILLVSDVGLELDMDPSGAGGTRELLLLRPFLALTGGVPSRSSILGDAPSPT